MSIVDLIGCGRIMVILIILIRIERRKQVC